MAAVHRRAQPAASAMTVAACSCGALSIACNGEPVRRSVCHCRECQRRTGSAFGIQVHYRQEDVAITGVSTKWSRRGESGLSAEMNFCPTCGSTVFWRGALQPGVVTVAVGNIADPSFPPPTVSVYEESKHPWWDFTPALPIERWD